MAFAFALLAAVFLGFNLPAWVFWLLALAARLVLKSRIDGHFRHHAGPILLMPLRDLLSFAGILVSLFGETVRGRGTHFAVEPAARCPRSEGPGSSLRFPVPEV